MSLWREAAAKYVLTDKKCTRCDGTGCAIAEDIPEDYPFDMMPAPCPWCRGHGVEGDWEEQ